MSGVARKFLGSQPRALRGALIAFSLLIAVLNVPNAKAQDRQEPGQVTASINGTYARLVFSFSKRPKHSISASALQGGILVLKFDQPVDISVSGIAKSLPGYVSNARRDNDGKSLRFALERQIRVNTSEVNNELYLDLLPEPWVSDVPALPKNVLDELMRQAQEEQRLKADADERAKRAVSLGKVDVKASEAPTFTRLAFQWSDKVQNSLKRDGDQLILTFEKTGDISLAGIQVSLPRFVSAIKVEEKDARMIVTMTVDPMRDVRLFDEGNAVFVDIQGPQRGALELQADGAVKTSAAAGLSPASPAVTIYGKTKEDAVVADNGATPSLAKNFALSAPDTSGTQVQKPDAATTSSSEPGPVTPPAAPPEQPLGELEAKAATAKIAMLEDKAAAQVGDDDDHADGKIHPDGNVVDGAGLRLTFSYPVETGATFFQRGNTVWFAFASAQDIDTAPIKALFERKLRRISEEHQDKLTVLRMEFSEPYLISAASVDSSWVLTFGDHISGDYEPAEMKSHIAADGRSVVNAYMNRAVAIHKVHDPVVGDDVTLVLAIGPTIGMIKPQQFVDFSAFATMQGAALLTTTDDIKVRLDDVGFVIELDGSLAVSAAKTQHAANIPGQQGQTSLGFVDFEGWKLGRQDEFTKIKDGLVRKVAMQEGTDKNAARLDLARFYIAYAQGQEALGTLKLVAEQDPATERETSFRVMHGVANYLSGRFNDALHDLEDPALDENGDVAVWRGLSYAANENWIMARKYLEKAQAVLPNYARPIQGDVLTKLANATINIQDMSNTDSLLDEAEHLVVDEKAMSEVKLLRGRFNEAVGRSDIAVDFYRQVDPDKYPSVGSEAVLHMIVLQEKLGQITRNDAIARLEALSFAWRGGDLELEIYRQLGEYYTKEKSYRKAFAAMRDANLANADSDISRKLFDDMRVVFVSYFLDGKSDDVPAPDVLSLFYDFRELTPAGRIGDDIIRRLSERLVEVDLLDQAIALLDHQVEHRLAGMTRTEVATELSLIYLMNREPQKALSVLHRTRQASMPPSLENTRTLIEARALAGTGRPELAIELLSGAGVDIKHLRADILWEAKRWDECAAALDGLLGDRWRSDAPLTDKERGDVMRAAVSYALAENPETLQSFRAKYVQAMSATPDAYLFDVATGAIEKQGSEFRALAKNLAAIDNLGSFWDIYRAMKSKQSVTRAEPLATKKPA